MCEQRISDRLVVKSATGQKQLADESETPHAGRLQDSKQAAMNSTLTIIIYWGGNAAECRVGNDIASAAKHPECL